MKLNASIFVMDDGVTPTNLEAISLNSNGTDPMPNQEVLVIGHGRNEYSAYYLEEDLMEVTLFTYDDQVCIDIYAQTADEGSSELSVVPESMVSKSISYLLDRAVFDLKNSFIILTEQFFR
jgi:hypothetical protein